MADDSRCRPRRAAAGPRGRSFDRDVRPGRAGDARRDVGARARRRRPERPRSGDPPRPRRARPGPPISKIKSVDEIRAGSLARERFLMTMLVVFAVVGLLLAVIGVYGVLGQVARRRTREMGIRIALGSPVSRVRWIVVRHG